ncbi:unnamed protein product [Spirodela intermedia]|uniref:Protein kinase domain-containing protein n=1 Tax=Spirodela intermedia TaxID=51605 RepID=A0A7I8IIG0_SPIIN|nr:unnamed protein product [Spirodela intermedia]CAA6656945.1 unnamed protein product [Spirodela intermedia]
MAEAGEQWPAEGGGIREEKVLFGKYELGRLLGRGAFAKVYLAKDVRSGESAAVKCISKQRIIKGGLAANIKREISIMRRLRHPHIVRLTEVLASRSKIYFVMELVKGGELFSRLSRGVFHRDLKPENLLLDENGDLKVTDFGLSAVSDQTGHDGLLHTLCGTPAYVAPEILAKKGYDGAKVDVWSCGIVLFKICRGEFRCPRWFSPELKRLIGRLLDTNPETRSTVEEIIRDPWFRKDWTERGGGTDGLRPQASRHQAGGGGGGGGKGPQCLRHHLLLVRVRPFRAVRAPPRRRERAVVSGGATAQAALGMLEQAARGEELVVRKEGKKVLSMLTIEAPNGTLIAAAGVSRLNDELSVVELEEGPEIPPTLEGFWEQKLMPVLKSLPWPPPPPPQDPSEARPPPCRRTVAAGPPFVPGS